MPHLRLPFYILMSHLNFNNGWESSIFGGGYDSDLNQLIVILFIIDTVLRDHNL